MGNDSGTLGSRIGEKVLSLLHLKAISTQDIVNVNLNTTIY